MITIMIIIVYLNMLSLLQLSLSLLHNISGNQTWQWNPRLFLETFPMKPLHFDDFPLLCLITVQDGNSYEYQLLLENQQLKLPVGDAWNPTHKRYVCYWDLPD